MIYPSRQLEVAEIDSDFDFDNRSKVIEHLEETYGKDHVAHIGTFSYLGVKSGIKDVGRVLRIPFDVVNGINKKLDEIIEAPGASFADYDSLKDSPDPLDREKWKEFNKLEQENPELFRLARRFEGTPRQYGIHASGILIMPMPVNVLFPTRKAKDGTTVTIYTGEQLEELKAIKFDILGLKTLTIIKNTLKHIDPNLTFDDLYQMVDVNDPNIYKMICNKETDALFQLESNLFKGVIGDIQPDTLEDIIAITSMCRPGPLSAGMHLAYARRKREEEEATPPLPGIDDIVGKTFGTIIYQEQCMLIAQKVAGFDDNQADSYLRKALAKKKKDKMDICRQWFIYGKKNEEPPAEYDPENKNQPYYDPEGKHGAPIKGGVNNGYKEEDLANFWSKLEGYASYLFNKSHAATYSYTTLLTAYLKCYYPTEFMAAVLSMQEDDKSIAYYMKICDEMDIKIKTPDINKSEASFTPSGKSILYGLGSIKGVGASSVMGIIENRPYESLEDVVKKIPKKTFNKRVGTALIQAGAFDFETPNRYELLNRFFDLRGDKDERYVVEAYDEEACMEMERKVLGAPVTFKPWWDTVPKDKRVQRVLKLKNLKELMDRYGRLMAFLELETQGATIKGVVFSKQYSKLVGILTVNIGNELLFTGKKDDQGSFIVSKAEEMRDEEEELKAYMNKLLN